MKNFLALCFLLVISSSVAISQNSDQEKQLNNVEKLLKKNKVEKAEKKLIKLIEEYPDYGEAWDKFAGVKNYYYRQTKNSTGDSHIIRVAINGSKKAKKNDTAELLQSLLSGITNISKTYNDYLYTLRSATANAPNAHSSSMELRNLLRENYKDTTLQEKEINLFELAEKEFRAKNYNKAAIYYQKALDENPNYYKAFLYLADSYYMMENYIDAIKKFKDCIERFPKFVEPRKYLVDSYLSEGLYEDALNAAIESKYAYPDLIMNYRLLQAAYELNKEATVWPIPRTTLPGNTIFKDSLISTSIFTKETPSLEDMPKLIIKPYWETYNIAVTTIKPYCSNEGIVTKKNGLTNSNYAEVFRWEKMLAEHNDPDLETAKEMQRLGYLDCYVLITCFHDDFYEQYRHFADNNKEKIIRYYNDVVLKSNN